MDFILKMVDKKMEMVIYFDDNFEIEFILELDTSEDDVKYQDLGGYDKDIDVNTDEEGPDV